ncbi:MAG: hypothetical protein NC350_01415 [Corallococcus sp.]|nr:hypothetical protein [Corallococcus sp.]
MREFSAKIKQSRQPKCPNCGADMRYSPQTGNLTCEHCDSVKQIVRDRNVRERDFKELTEVEHWSDSDVAAYRCKNCGATTVLPSSTIATDCPFCGASVVVDSESLNSVRPDTVIPFETTDEQARQAILKWRKKRLLAPNSFKKEVKVDSVKGAYIPVWTFDSYVTAYYEGTLGKRRTRTVRRDGKTYTETYIDWFPVSGSTDKIFDDIFVYGNSDVPSEQMAKLGAFPQSKYVVYNDEYLAGYIADNYTVEPYEAFEIAERKMRSRLTSEIESYYNADVVSQLDIQLDYKARSFKYLMVPVYVTATGYRNKVYNNYVSGIMEGSGQSQPRVVGKAPKSPYKICAIVLAVLAVVAAICLGIALNADAIFGDWDWDLSQASQPIGQIRCYSESTDTFTALFSRCITYL